MKRIQRKRTKGWKMPPNTIYVGRPTKWGNPYQGLSEIPMYREWVKDEIKAGRLNIRELRGHNLACWCPLDAPCHADILLEIANQ
jgi:hypothetical protein